MDKTISAGFREALDALLPRSFVDGVTWPIGPAELAALVDMGMPDGQIAAYFSVELAAVRKLRQRYEL
jgi:hypothetical protein